MNILDINARSILDSRGTPTVEAEVWCEGGYGRAAVPSGASTGSHEAHELRDGSSAFGGKDVQQAVQNIKTEIRAALQGTRVDDQFYIDRTMIALDGTEQKSRLGANALLAVSLACAHAASFVRGIPLFQQINDIAGNPAQNLPMPMLNVLNGGKHATNSADFQEYMLVPLGAHSYRQAIQIATEIFTTLKHQLALNNLPTTVGDEGGFTLQTDSNTDALDLLTEAVIQSGYKPGTDVAFALDVAASELYTDGTYALKTENRSLTATEMITYLKDIAAKHPVISVEDGLYEDAWTDWKALTAELTGLQIVGDDLLVTNTHRLTHAIAEQSANAILIKPNQIGTLTETLETIKLAQSKNWRTVISHRSGETEDTTIAHLAVGTGSGQIKTGSVSRGERTAKHNELLRLEDSNPELQLAHPF